MKQESAERSGIVSQTDVKSLLQILEVKLTSPTRAETVLALCDFAGNHSWVPDRLTANLNVQGPATKLTVHGINSQEVVDAQMGQLKLTLSHSGDSKCSTFYAKTCMSEST